MLTNCSTVDASSKTRPKSPINENDNPSPQLFPRQNHRLANSLQVDTQNSQSPLSLKSKSKSKSVSSKSRSRSSDQDDDVDLDHDNPNNSTNTSVNTSATPQINNLSPVPFTFTASSPAPYSYPDPTGNLSPIFPVLEHEHEVQFFPGDKKHGAPKSAPIFFCFLAFLAEMFLNEGADFFVCFLNNRPTQARSAGFFFKPRSAVFFAVGVS